MLRPEAHKHLMNLKASFRGLPCATSSTKPEIVNIYSRKLQTPNTALTPSLSQFGPLISFQDNELRCIQTFTRFCCNSHNGSDHNEMKPNKNNIRHNRVF